LRWLDVLDALKVSQSRFTHLNLKDSRAAGRLSYMESYPTAARCAVCSVRCTPLGSGSKSVRAILISDNEQVCPAADRLHGDVHSLGNDDRLERPAI
jgi:hypothetical protein